MRSTIVCVDDDKLLLNIIADLINEWLGSDYFVERALSGAEALSIIDARIDEGVDISLVISDYIMPKMKGDELLEKVKLKTPMTRCIMLTGCSDLGGVVNAVNRAGIYRYISKPWDNKDMLLMVLQAIRGYEQDKRAEMLAANNKEMLVKLKGVTSSLKADLRQAMLALSEAAALRDNDVPGHAERVAGYAMRFVNKLGLSETDAESLGTAALLHDVGKLCLNDAELELVRGLKCYGNGAAARRQAEQAKQILRRMNPEILPGVMYYLERADGLGPFAISARNIPVSAKIIGLCNYYDVLAAGRHNAAPCGILDDMAKQTGKLFDPELFEVFSALIQ